ncbi:MAG: hypothetical protein KDB00_01780 [Planctomycetales bacterium]|nr:hypothetical protein [Planctomycetales bacterium]
MNLFIHPPIAPGKTLNRFVSFARSIVFLGVVLAISFAFECEAQTESASGTTQVNNEQARQEQSLDQVAPVDPIRRRVLIVIGLSGDQENHDRFAKVSSGLQDWLTEFAGVKRNDMTVLQGSDAAGQVHLAATQENIRRVTERLTSEIGADESLWVFLIGHGSVDNRHGWFHLPGPDMNAQQWASLFADVKASEQVFWLTHSASGRFLKPFSLPGRVVITATDDTEVNQTRFPDAFLQVVTNQSAEPGVTQPSNALTLFLRVCDQVRRSFDENNSVATEHAQLDDNGDGKGSEWNQLAGSATDSAGSAAAAVVDGLRAAAVRFTPLPQQPKPDESEEADTESSL